MGLKELPQLLKPLSEHKTVDKGHGRLEIRKAYVYDIKEEYFDNPEVSGWNKCDINTLIVMQRTFLENKTGKTSEETSYYITNQLVSKLNAATKGKVLIKLLEIIGR